MEQDKHMTTKKQVIRLVIIAVVLVGAFFGGRELYYARHITQNSIQVKLESADLTKQSSGIIQGTVEKKLSTKRFTDASGELMVNTLWQVKIDETYKGTFSQSLVVETPGGRYGLTEVVVEDAPTLAVGEKVLLYLQPIESSSDYQLTGQFQGHFTVTKDEKGNEVFVQQGTEIKETKTLIKEEIKAINVQQE